METRAHYVLIGFFTVIVAAGGLMFGLWLAKSGKNQDYKLYDIVFHEAVSGLSVGNAVEYSGIRVGEVKNLWLDPQDPRRVWARVAVGGNTPVRQDTRARLALANITGASNIQLSSSSPNSPPLVGDEEQIPRIMAEPSPFSRLKMNSEELLVNLTELIENAKALLSKENARLVNQVLANLETASSAFAEQKDEIGRGLKDLSRAGDQARKAASQASLMMNRLNGLVEKNSQALGAGMQGLAELGPAIQELRMTLNALGDVARRLEENPAGYLLGRKKIKEFQP
ncbi:MAG: MCE family protein [Desulfuromonadaceae bacterium]|nr:MCE family protein [Desulfuromonadaceae bacterium]